MMSDRGCITGDRCLRDDETGILHREPSTALLPSARPFAWAWAPGFGSNQIIRTMSYYCSTCGRDVYHTGDWTYWEYRNTCWVAECHQCRVSCAPVGPAVVEPLPTGAMASGAAGCRNRSRTPPVSQPCTPPAVAASHPVMPKSNLRRVRWRLPVRSSSTP
jgi:hypothetical protein